MWQVLFCSCISSLGIDIHHVIKILGSLWGEAHKDRKQLTHINLWVMGVKVPQALERSSVSLHLHFTSVRGAPNQDPTPRASQGLGY